MKKVKVIYILGSGHSGSTLLNLILGSTEKIFAAGEIKSLQMCLRHYLDERRCSCKQLLPKCSFWQDIVARFSSRMLFPTSGTLSERISIALSIIFSRTPRFARYEDRKLYSDILAQAQNIKGQGVKMIVDSSKDLRRLVYLNTLKNLDISVIHLIRDGRAVVNSHERVSGMIWPVKHWLQGFLDWAQMNLLSFLYLRRKNIDSITISYDKFAQYPTRYMRKINECFGLDIDEEHYIENINKEEYHNFAGNPIKHKKIDAITYDQSWRRRMPKWKQWILTVLCWIPNKLWVYNRKL